MTSFYFLRTLTAAELESHALSLADDAGRNFAGELPSGVTSLFIVVEGGLPSFVSLRSEQIMGPNLAAWFRQNDLTEGAVVRIRWLEAASQFGKPLITLAIADQGTLTAYRAANSPAIPIHLQPDVTVTADVLVGDARADLESLEDWEAWLSHQLRSVTLIGELDITEDDYRTLGRLLGARFKMGCCDACMAK